MSEDEFTILPFSKHATESRPKLYLQKRPKFSPELKITLSGLAEIGANDYVEIYTNSALTKIKLVSVKKQTAYSRSVTTDAIAWGRVGGANKLVEMGYPIGRYVMTDKLVFKYAGKL